MEAMPTTVALSMPTVPRQRRSPADVAAAAPVDGPKKVLLASPRGYCAGVDRAVIAVEKALEHYGAPVYVRKEIVHNKHVVETLAARGAVFVDETDEVPEGSLLIFSAHGVSPAVVRSAEDRQLRTIDATCPLVTKVHREATRFARDEFHILFIGCWKFDRLFAFLCLCLCLCLCRSRSRRRGRNIRSLNCSHDFVA
jgi:4-hydroxy-3-methylbut-2-enyl diphosphate reductase